MNPEDQFKRLRDESLWSDDLVPRVARPATRGSVWRWVVPVIAGFVVAALVVVGVNALRIDKPQPAVIVPTQVQVSTPAPTETVVPSAQWKTPPDQVFGGDCAQLFTPAEVSNLLGEQISGPVLSTDDNGVSVPGLSVVRQNGGMECAWQGAEAGVVTPSLSVIVIPADVFSTPPSGPDCDGSNYTCNFTIPASGLLLSGAVTSRVDDIQVQLAAIFRQKAASVTSMPGHWTRRPDDWPASVDCAKLAIDADFETSLGKGKFNTDELGVGASTSVGLAIQYGHGGSFCGYTSQHEYEPGYISHWGVQILSGGAWTLKEISTSPVSRPVSIPGADHAYVMTFATGEAAQSSVFVFAGQNMFTLAAGTENVSALYPLVPALIKALDKL